ncbi:oxidoreductase [Streptomyces cellostaticus]|uniref:Oxidoreductase n=1 Tax=Streptomyces cellostaticus TaxID=67285 RepID=A0A117PV16_9ACTN|nr:aldo/keto reductase [Streptomyces cellostaticus]KUM93530.1 oxidoreductase [Streptomyces cellostaticus]GHI04284.1 oxidoreductase [Streptomyces cellostaticus]
MTDPEAPDPYVRLGRLATRVSRLWLGTVNFSGRVEDDDALTLMDEALDRGINCVDTADIYGWRVHKGHTEELVGRWLAQGGGRRDKVVLATKVGGEMSEQANDGGLSARHIVAACEQSLRRLGVECIDLYQMHHIDRAAPWDEVWQAMDRLVASGKILYVGSSNFAGWHICEAQASAARRNALGLASEQCLYNLAVRHAELEVLPAARHHGLATLAWSPLHGGLLSGVLDKLRSGTAVKSAQGRAQTLLPSLRPAIEEYEAFCGRIGRHPAEVGLAWVLSRPGITGAVIGPRTVEQLDSALRATRLRLADEELAELDRIFPPVGRGGPAPEAWAQ